MKIAKGDNALDRLSELPESLILHILSLLETRDAVKTALLSKRWIDIWTTVPCLRFCEPASLQTRKFIDRVVQGWKGTKIQRFVLNFTKEYDESMSGVMDSWLRFATEKNVEELFLLLPSDYTTIPLPQRSDPVYSLPRCLYSCSSITTLRLIGNHNLEIPGNLQWDRLTHLRIRSCSISEDVINKLVSSTPHLKSLDFRIVGSYDQSLISIQSTSLRSMWIFKQRHSTSLKIWAPNLVYLQIGGLACSATCSLSNVSSLTYLDLMFSDSCDEALGKTLNQILPTIKRVKALTLSFGCFKMLGVMIMKGKHSFSVPFTNVKMLKLDGGFVEPYDISGLVEIFPKVRKLIIVWSADHPWYTFFAKKLSEKHGIGENYLQVLEAKNLKPFLMQLRTAEVTWPASHEVASIFNVIKFVLKDATMVQSLVQKIVIKEEDSKARLLEALVLQAPQELVSLQRSFPSVNMIYCQK